MYSETELKCPSCNLNIRVRLHQPSWFSPDVVGSSPSSLYRNDYQLRDLLTINKLLGEQNDILKQQVTSLMKSLKYYIDLNKQTSEEE